jgi:hypothetical protein
MFCNKMTAAIVVAETGTLTRPNSIISSSHLYGTLPVVKGCAGPHISTKMGMDGFCCLRCFQLRLRLYKKSSIVLKDERDLAYLQILEEATANRDSGEQERMYGISTSYVISRCSKLFISVEPYYSEQEYGNAKNFLRRQFIARKSMKVANATMSRDFLGMTILGLPVILPSEDMIHYNTYGGDEGVQLQDVSGTQAKTKSVILVVKDREKALKSGKWMHVINFHEICSLLFHKSELVDSLEIF